MIIQILKKYFIVGFCALALPVYAQSRIIAEIVYLKDGTSFEGYTSRQSFSEGIEFKAFSTRLNTLSLILEDVTVEADSQMIDKDPITLKLKWSEIERFVYVSSDSLQLSGINVSVKTSNRNESFVGTLTEQTVGKELKMLLLDGTTKTIQDKDILSMDMLCKNDEQSIWSQALLVDTIVMKNGDKKGGIIIHKNYEKPGNYYYMLQTHESKNPVCVNRSDIKEMISSENHEYNPIFEHAYTQDSILINHGEKQVPTFWEINEYKNGLIYAEGNVPCYTLDYKDLTENDCLELIINDEYNFDNLYAYPIERISEDDKDVKNVKKELMSVLDIEKYVWYRLLPFELQIHPIVRNHKISRGNSTMTFKNPSTGLYLFYQRRERRAFIIEIK